MSLRAIEIVVTRDCASLVRKTLDENKPIDRWTVAEDEEGGRRVVIRALLDPDYQQPTLDALHDCLSGAEDWRIIVSPVEAALPRPEPDEDALAKVERSRRTATRDVLYSTIEAGAEMDADYLLFVVLSTVVAGVALVTDNVAVLIGAMVIAPFLGPNLGFAFGAALGDRDLMLKAVTALGAGLAISLSLSILAGALLPIDLEGKELLDRTQIGLGGMAVALASGACAALALTSGASASLVGVMVAVALLPPAVALGIMIGAGAFEASLGAALVLVVNVASVNLAALAIFRFRGIEPRAWLEKYKARQSRRRAFIALGLLMLILAIAISARGNWQGWAAFAS